MPQAFQDHHSQVKVLAQLLQSLLNLCHFTLYDIDVPGYESGLNKLHLFDIDTLDESIVGDGISFDKSQIAKNLTLFLYPDDSDKVCTCLAYNICCLIKIYATLL